MSDYVTGFTDAIGIASIVVIGVFLFVMRRRTQLTAERERAGGTEGQIWR